MAKEKWDGNFEDAYWVDCENPVEELIENSGRILREPTSDGYTHDIVYRSGYVSEDYYFPSTTRGNGHDHYELHSNGDIIKNGKKLNHNIHGGNSTMIHGKQRGRNKGLDGTILTSEANDAVKENQKLHELGEKYVGDKKKLEDELEKVRKSKISDDDKREIVEGLEAALDLLEHEYYTDVEEEQNQINDDLRETTERMQEAADELQNQSDSLRGVRMDAASKDGSDAADAADRKKQEFEKNRAEYLDKLNLQIEQQQQQQRLIRNRRLSGR